MDLVLDILRPILSSRLVTTWLLTNPTDPSSISELKQWIEEMSSVSVTFASFAELTLYRFGATSLRRKGIRRNLAAAGEAGRKDIWPFMGVLNRISYFKAISRDEQEYAIRAPEPVRADHRANYSFGETSSNKEPIDFWMEGSIHQQKPQMTSSSVVGMESASAMASLDSSLRKTLYREAGREQPRDSLERSRTVITETYSKVEALMANLPNPFAVTVRVEDVEDKLRALDGRILPPTSSMTFLRELGVKNIVEYCGTKRHPVRVRLQCQGDKQPGDGDSDDEDEQLGAMFVAQQDEDAAAARAADAAALEDRDAEE